MLVSFILPIYNTPIELLIKGLDIFIENKNENIEVILVDDGSVKEVAEILDEYGSKYDLFKVFHQENQGVSVARNLGIKNSSGKYIIFVDPDDYIMPDAVDMHFFEEIQSDVILFNYIRKTREGEEKNISIKVNQDLINVDELIKNVLFCNNIYGSYYAGAIWAKAFKREFLINQQIVFDKSLRKAQDRLFMLDVYNKAVNIELSNKYTYVYYENMQSICNAYKPNSTERSELFAFAVKKYIDNNAVSNANLLISKTFFITYFEMLYLDIFNIQNKQKYIVKRKVAKEKYNQLRMREKMKYLGFKDCENFNEKIKFFFIKHRFFWGLKCLISYRQSKRTINN